MPHPLAWHDDWSLGIPELDADHRALIECLAAVIARFGRHGDRRDQEALFAALAELGEQARAHFEREESLMRALAFDGLGDHRGEHALLMAEYVEMVRAWRAQGVRVLDASRQETLRRWVIDHVLGADRDFASTWRQLSDRHWAEVEWSPVEVTTPPLDRGFPDSAAGYR